MQLTFDSNLNNLCEPYIVELANRFRHIDKKDWDEEVYHLLGETVDYIENDRNDLKLSHLYEVYAAGHGIKELDLLFDGDLKRLPFFLMGEDWSELFFAAIKLEACCPYSTGYFRRSVRSKDVGLHSNSIVYLLHDFTVMRASGFSPEEWLMKEREFEECNLLTDSLFAVLIRKENRKAIDYFRQALTDKNKAKRLSWDHFRAIVKSGNEALLELEEKLLLSAGLQEGLRQAIIETADEGLPNSYVHILKVVKENGLHRFASIQRGVAVTTGMGEIDSPAQLSRKTVDLVYDYLTDRDKRYEDFLSEDPVKVYLALWAIAFYNVDDLKNPLEVLINIGERHQIEAALILLDNIGNLKFSSPFAAMSLRRHQEDFGIVAGALPLYLRRRITVTDDVDLNEALRNENKDRWENFFENFNVAYSDFEILEKIYHSLKKKIVIEPYVFPSLRKELSKDLIASKMCEIAELVDTPEIKDKVLDYINGVDSYGRGEVIKRLLSIPSSRRQIEFIIDNMGNTSREVRLETSKIIEKLFEAGELIDSDFNRMEGLLRLKASETRVAIIKIFSRLPEQEARETVKRLIQDKVELRRLAGLEIIKCWSGRNERLSTVASLVPVLKKLTPMASPLEKSLIDEIMKKTDLGTVAYSLENGFGLYDPTDNPVVIPEWPSGFNVSEELSFGNPAEGIRIMEKLMALIEKNADLEFTTSWGEVRRIGNGVLTEYDNNGYRKMKLGYPEIWMQFYKDEIKSTKNLLRLVIPFYFDRYLDIDKTFKPVIKRFMGKAFNKDFYKRIEGKRYFASAKAIILNLYEYLNDESVWETLVDFYSDIATRIEPDETVQEEIRGDDQTLLKSAIWLEAPLCSLDNVFVESRSFSDNLFRRYFSAMYSLFGKSSFMTDRYLDGIGILTLYPRDFLRAWEAGILTDRQFIHELLGRPYSHYLIKYFTAKLPYANTSSRVKHDVDDIVLSVDAQIIIKTVMERILEIELKRGSTPTEVSHLAKSLGSVTGIDNFLGILVALGNEKFNIYSSSAGTLSKRDILSHLLLVSSPAAMDTAYELLVKSKEAGISVERLVEAAVYSPRWLEIVEDAIGWKGLTSGTYYFHAHTGAELSEYIKSQIRRFSMVPVEDFADGAFDSDWFREIYETLGEGRFNTIYDASKYISGNNRHIRSRKLSDAALGRVGVKDIMKEISDKRDRNQVVALGLVPLSEKEDVAERYRFLNSFLKEGKKTGGAQRREAEARAVKLSLDNLARNSGYADSTRLTWTMESNMIENLTEFLSPMTIEQITVYIKISEGLPELVIENNGKAIKSLPSKLKKNPYVSDLKEAYNTLKDQHVRGRALLEASMAELTVFSASEIMGLKRNPIIWNMLSRLILIKNNKELGFATEDGKSLITADGEVVELYVDDSLRIAHPYDLFKNGDWSKYQRSLFDRKWRQPFKQIFRELYLPTIDEYDKSVSNRYSGNQLKVNKTIGVLGTRGWIIDYEQGLQKTLFTHNVVARIYAMADWYSPADIEAPTLEYVEFLDRRTSNPKLISEINPIVFSEIMRDVDLAVSVAHAGGTDPEASHSTIEMRSMIARHSARLFGLRNIELCGNFIKIKGSIADYSIHLGSGVIHQEGGAEIAVLPVHSQSRGRIFMPFVDDDPKTAEIITKMLMFADDTKIKDPSILRQINRKD